MSDGSRVDGFLDKYANGVVIITVIVVLLVVCWIIYYSDFNRDTFKTFDIHNNVHFTLGAVQHRKPIAQMLDDSKQRIPLVIIQTNEKDEIPRGMYSATKTILDYNPEYTYIYFNDSAARKYIIDNYPQRVLDAYDKLIPGAYKADLFRYCVLYKMGGVYIDMGMVAKCPLRDVIRPSDEFVSPEDAGYGYVYNAFICSVPGHPILKNAIDISVYNIEKSNYGVNALDVTGPCVLAKALKYHINKQISVRSGSPVNYVNWKLVAGGNYGNGIRLLSYIKHNQLLVEESYVSRGIKSLEGDIYDGELLLFTTRYYGYRDDVKWYNTKKHYGILWTHNVIYTEEISSDTEYPVASAPYH